MSLTKKLPDLQKIPPLVRKLIAAAEKEEVLLEALAAAVGREDRDAVFIIASQLAAQRGQSLGSSAPKL